MTRQYLIKSQCILISFLPHLKTGKIDWDSWFNGAIQFIVLALCFGNCATAIHCGRRACKMRALTLWFPGSREQVWPWPGVRDKIHPLGVNPSHLPLTRPYLLRFLYSNSPLGHDSLNGLGHWWGQNHHGLIRLPSEPRFPAWGTERRFNTKCNVKWEQEGTQ